MDDIDMFELLARPEQQAGGTAHRALREGQRAGHRRAGPVASPPCSTSRSRPTRPTRQQAGRHDPELRRHPARAFRARRLWPQLPGAPEPQSLARCALGARTTTRASALISTPSRPPKSPAGSRGRPCCSTARCSPAATPRTSASRTCSLRVSRCRWTSPTASSTTSARWTRCATRSSARPAPPPPRAWTSSPR